MKLNLTESLWMIIRLARSDLLEVSDRFGGEGCAGTEAGTTRLGMAAKKKVRSWTFDMLTQNSLALFCASNSLLGASGPGIPRLVSPTTAGPWAVK